MQEEFKARALNSIDSGLESVEKELSQLSRERVECLDAVVKCQRLITWLKENIGGKLFLLLPALVDNHV